MKTVNRAYLFKKYYLYNLLIYFLFHLRIEFNVNVQAMMSSVCGIA